MINQPYKNSTNQWVVDLTDGTRLGPFDTSDAAYSALSQVKIRDELTAFSNGFSSKIRDMYSIQKDMLLMLDTFAKKKFPAKIASILDQNASITEQNNQIKARNDSIPSIVAQNEAIQAQNAANALLDPPGPVLPLYDVPAEEALLPLLPVPSKFTDFTDLLEGADLSSMPGMTPALFAQVMQTVFEILMSVTDAQSAVMYQAIPLPR